MKNTFSDVLVDNPGTQCFGDTLCLDVRLPWYRSLPLSVIAVAQVRLDGAELSLAGATVVLDGKRCALADLPGLVDAWWFVQDSAFIELPVPGLDTAAPHEVELQLNVYPPYIPMLTWITRGSKTLPAQ